MGNFCHQQPAYLAPRWNYVWAKRHCLSTHKAWGHLLKFYFHEWAQIMRQQWTVLTYPNLFGEGAGEAVEGERNGLCAYKSPQLLNLSGSAQAAWSPSNRSRLPVLWGCVKPVGGACLPGASNRSTSSWQISLLSVKASRCYWPPPRLVNQNCSKCQSACIVGRDTVNLKGFYTDSLKIQRRMELERQLSC